jgi:DNA-binding GntR family transcriptional regulator
VEKSAEQVTQILEAVGAGDEQAADKLLPLVYEELRRLAGAKMAQQPRRVLRYLCKRTFHFEGFWLA